VIRDTKNGYPLQGISVYSEVGKSGAVSDSAGRYTLTSLKGRHTIYATGKGKIDAQQQAMFIQMESWICNWMM
jgi:hypothetical protein